MPAYFDATRKRWSYEFDRLIDGRRHRARKLLPKGWSRTQADAYAREQDARLYALASGAQREEPLISEAVRLYLLERGPELKNQSKCTADLALAFDWYKARRMSELADVVAKYRADHPSLAPATIRNRMAYLRAACRWAWKHKGMGSHDPGERVAMPQVRNERHSYAGRREILQLARSIRNLDHRAFVLIGFYSGMRLSEIARAQPTRDGWLLTDTKNGERRLVPIHPRVAHLARAWPRPVSTSSVQKSYIKARDAMGLSWLRFHDLRHSTASAMVQAGVDLYTVGGVLGHKSAASTKRYAHLANRTLAKALSAL